MGYSGADCKRLAMASPSALPILVLPSPPNMAREVKTTTPKARPMLRAAEGPARCTGAACGRGVAMGVGAPGGTDGKVICLSPGSGCADGAEGEESGDSRGRLAADCGASAGALW